MYLQQHKTPCDSLFRDSGYQESIFCGISCFQTTEENGKTQQEGLGRDGAIEVLHVFRPWERR